MAKRISLECVNCAVYEWTKDQKIFGECWLTFPIFRRILAKEGISDNLCTVKCKWMTFSSQAFVHLRDDDEVGFEVGDLMSAVVRAEADGKNCTYTHTHTHIHTHERQQTSVICDTVTHPRRED